VIYSLRCPHSSPRRKGKREYSRSVCCDSLILLHVTSITRMDGLPGRGIFYQNRLCSRRLIICFFKQSDSKLIGVSSGMSAVNLSVILRINTSLLMHRHDRVAFMEKLWGFGPKRVLPARVDLLQNFSTPRPRVHYNWYCNYAI
jgi:hypothetical protein